jgi:hypothetical protein
MIQDQFRNLPVGRDKYKLFEVCSELCGSREAVFVIDLELKIDFLWAKQ